jgi:hypothetical protein
VKRQKEYFFEFLAPLHWVYINSFFEYIFCNNNAFKSNLNKILMDSKSDIEQTYHGTTNPDDEPSLSRLDDLGLHGFRVRDAQSLLVTDRNHMKMNQDAKVSGIRPLPRPFNEKEANSLWIGVQEQYRQQRLKPYLSSSG